MFGDQKSTNEKTDTEKHWTVHAEFTISHDGLTEQGIGPPTTHTEQDENGAVRLVYRWTSVQTHPTDDEQCNTEPTIPPTHVEGQNRSTPHPHFIFTSVPPPPPPPPAQTKPQHQTQGGSVRNVLNKFPTSAPANNKNSSGYSSEQLMSPSNCSTNNCRNHQHLQPLYNRRCRSTCSIVLSTNINTGPRQSEMCEIGTGSTFVPTTRTHSLRCQIPTNKELSNLYGCGDPWCYHSSNYGDECAYRFSPLIEADEYTTAPTASIKSTNTTARLSNRSLLSTDKCCKDASVQTYEMVDKCTSPFLFTNQQDESGIVTGKLNVGSVGHKKRPTYLSRRKTEPIRRAAVKNRGENDWSMSPDSLDSKQYRVKRYLQPQQQQFDQNIEPSDLKNPLTTNQHPNLASGSSNSTQSDMKQPRTVHIDVYCTGTEQESSSSSSSSTDANNNNDDQTISSPQTVFESSDMRITHVRADSNTLPNRIVKDQLEFDQDDDDLASISYPSLDVSSFSTNPWSLSSCDTSWKDTGSDLVSLLEGSNRLNDSIGSRSKVFGCAESITEMPEHSSNKDKRGVQTPSSFDSFEYAASEDKIRIKKLDEELLTQWKSPQIERQKMLNKKAVVEECNLTDSSNDDDSDESVKGWSFVKGSLERDDTIKQRLPLLTALPKAPTVPYKSPSVLIVKQKLTKNPELRAPFTQSPGVFTEQRQIARRFGRIIDVYRKPGHHIGPAKNPDCTCNHCTEYFSGGFGRGRTQSVGNEGGMDFYGWKRRIGRGSEPPQSQEEIRLQLERDTGNNKMYGLTRNASFSNI